MRDKERVAETGREGEERDREQQRKGGKRENQRGQNVICRPIQTANA